MLDSITDVPGIKVGHAQDLEGGTGCTVIMCENGAATGADIRGGAPGTREISCLDPVNIVPVSHAVYLGGGSAYGLAGATGVMQFLEERNIGFNVGVGVVPIVPGAVLFDMPCGSPAARPDAGMGYRACEAAGDDTALRGNVGAGCGATVGKIRGRDYYMKGGLGTASMRSGHVVVGALAAVNCYGDIIDPATGRIIAGALKNDRKDFAGGISILAEDLQATNNPMSGNTTLGVIATNAAIDKTGATRVAMMAHDGLARAIHPVHTMYDGDSVFCMATGEIPCDLTSLGALAAEVLARAVIDAVRSAESLFGIPASRDIIGEL